MKQKYLKVTSLIIPVDVFFNSNECLRILPGDMVATLIQLKTGGDHDDNPEIQSVVCRPDNKTGWFGAEFSPFNEMANSVKNQIAMQSALEAAREIQQNFIPQETPRIERLDIAGQSVYCDATGGDYFDYMDFEGVCCRNTDHIFIAVGDVSGHGISAALLMASVRALLRSRFTCPGDLGEVVTDVNRLLVRDTNHTGQVMTLFYMDIHPKKDTVRWVRAGHEPGLLYIPEDNRFETLDGEGVALGIMESAVYREYRRDNMMPGQVLVIGTDGIWETQAPDGRMFGKDRLKMLIRQNAGKDAQYIQRAVIQSLNEFRGGMPMEDDVTLVVVKLIPTPPQTLKGLIT